MAEEQQQQQPEQQQPANIAPSEEGHISGAVGGNSSTCGSSSDRLYCSNNGKKKKHQHHRNLWTSRIMFLSFLCVVAAGLGYGTFRVLKNSEERLAQNQFEGIAERALDEVLKITQRKRRGAKSLAAVASNVFPDATTWPNVSMYGFEAIATSVMDTAEAFTMGLCPLVWPEQLAEFEAFAYDTAFTQINWHYPNNTGLNEFPEDNGQLKRGVFGFDQNLQRYRETDAKTSWNSSYEILTPIMMHSAGPPILMFNIHSMERFGVVIDELLDCVWNNPTKKKNQAAEEDAEVSLSDISYLDQCSVLSDFIIFYDKDGIATSPSSYIIQPIYPANDRQVLTGIVTSTMEWTEVLEHLFSSEVSGIDCVLETQTQAYTYSVQDGVATLKGVGHLQDHTYDRYSRSIELYGPGLFHSRSSTYTLTIYPNEELFDVFGTDNPVIALVGSLCIILLVSLLFLIYDYFFRQVVCHKQAVLEAKGIFVRFIEHEMRTPMNTICIGSNILQETLSKFADQHTKVRSGFPVPKAILQLREQLRDWSDITSDILVNANSAVNVLSDLLNYDKVESGSLPLELTIIPVASLVQRVATEFRIAAHAKNIEYNVSLSSHMQTDDGDCGTQSFSENTKETLNTEDCKEKHNTEDCEAAAGAYPKSIPIDIDQQYSVGDTVRISQILRIFISNAFEFTQNDGDIDVHISWKQDPSEANEQKILGDKTVSFSRTGYVQIDVKNSGETVSEAEIKQFNRVGFQYDLSKLESGQGGALGLHMSKVLAEQHGGYVRLSAKGVNNQCGTCFTLVLPLYDIPESELPDSLKNLREAEIRAKAEPSESDVDTSKARKPFRILVVDDSKVCRKMLIRLLRARGYSECDEAENGLRSVEMVKAAFQSGIGYDTILIDNEMPLMKGPDAVREIRRIGCTAFIAGVTGNLLPEDVQHFKQRGVDCVLPKPLNMSDLENRWAEHGVVVPTVRVRSADAA